MADSLTPWFISHLLNAAETYGAQIANIPLHDKKKKVQITEFLTFGSEEQDTYIWARVSDKQYIIPIKFSKEAVTQFRQITSRRLTQYKGAIVTIKQFKVISSRLPLDAGKPTKQSYLALECDSVRLLGSAGEPTFGNPKPLTTNADMQLWSEGLNQAGGAGNILKERKELRDQEAEQIFANFESRQATMPPPPPPLSLRPQADVRGKEQAVPFKKTKVTDMASYHARWQIVEKNIQYRHPPKEKEVDSVAPIQVKTPGSPVREKSLSKEPLQGLETKPSRSRSGTPIASWDRSPTSKLASSPIPENKLLSIEYANTTSSSLVPPTPAQRIKRPTITPEDHPSSSYPATANESILDIEIDAPEDVDSAPVRPQVARKVPRPTSPQPRQHTGPARVLAPNSDTSGTQSQSMSLTQQSLSLSLSLPHPLESDGRVGSSLPNNALQEADEEIKEENDDNISMEDDHEREEEDEERVRRSLTVSPEAEIESASGKSPSPEKSVHGDGDGRRYAGGSESDGGSGSEEGGGGSEQRSGTEEEEEDELEADGSDDGYPWMTLWSVRGVIVKANALRRGLPNVLVM